MFVIISLLLLLLGGYALLIGYYRRAWNQIPPADQSFTNKKKDPVKVTVIVPARNEEKNIGLCLDSLLQQSYPFSLLEIIIVNDHSTDNTAFIVKQFNESQIRLINLQDYISDEPLNAYKKKAIETAVGLSSGELLITTDADCTAPETWIENLVKIYQDQKAMMIAAPVKIIAGRSWISVFQALDFIALQGITGAAVQKKIYPMCNGANLAYAKAAFYAVDGFSGIDSIASGDDMLLMQKIRHRFPDRLIYLKSRDAIVSTHAVPNWKAFLQQRIRWASKTGHYGDNKTFLTLLLVYLLNLGLLFTAVAGFWNGNWFAIFGLFIMAKTLVEFRFVYTVASFFEQQQLMKYFFFFQPLHILYTVVAGGFGKFGHYEWKNRRVK